MERREIWLGVTAERARRIASHWAHADERAAIGRRSGWEFSVALLANGISLPGVGGRRNRLGILAGVGPESSQERTTLSPR